MTLTVVRRGLGEDAASLLKNDAVFSELAENKINTLNWPDEYPLCPEVSFRVFHNDEYLFVQYDVCEGATAALETCDGKDVYRDSCVEFFLQPSDADPHYYNFEWNAIGTLCMSRRTGRFDPVHATGEALASVLRASSYPHKAFCEVKGDNQWRLRVAIPCAALFGDSLKTWKGASLKGNFYKCGDGLSTPHYATWAPIQTPAPDYHRPEFFQDITCE